MIVSKELHDAETPVGDPRWAQITEILNEALRRRDPQERERFLRRTCSGDPEMRRDIEQLLSFEDADNALLDCRPMEQRAESPRSLAYGSGNGESPLEPGSKLGPYVVERWIGGGGMGLVAEAFDTTLERRVALKIIRSDRISNDSLARFERERRVLARLEHPNIAKIHDAGHHGGLPYFVMELVAGEPIDLWCDERRASVEQRIQLVLKICHALADAHRSLVVHRDLKPSNILVTAEGEPKLLDFGIAKELVAHSEQTTATLSQHFTLPYAAPEQLRGLPVATSTDVYALGVLLYRLLCGHPPYELEQDSLENLRRICEQEPEPPSQQVLVSLETWRGGEPEDLLPEALARRRNSDPRRLRRRLRGDLDAIVLKALAKEAGGRYLGVESLAHDLERHLAGLSVSARLTPRPALIYRWLVRHRWPLVTTFAGLLVLAVGLAWQQGQHQRHQAEQKRQLAEQLASEAEAEADAVNAVTRQLVMAMEPDGAGMQRVSVSELLGHAESEIRRLLGDRPEPLAHQLEALGLAHLSRSDFKTARPLLEDSLSLRRHLYPNPHRLVARGLNNLASLHHRAGDRRRAERLYRSSLEMKKALGQSADDLTRVESNLASLLVYRGEHEEAQGLFEHVLTERRQSPKANRRELSTTLRSLGNLLFLKGDLERAESFLREALELRLEEYGANNSHTAVTWSSLGRALAALGQRDEADHALSRALEIRRTRLGENHLHTALAKKDLAALLFENGESETAKILWSEAREVLYSSRPAGWELGELHSLYGAYLVNQGQSEAGRICLLSGYKRLSKERGEEALMTRHALERWQSFERLHL